MSRRTPLTWLVVTTMPDTEAREVALLGRAVFDVEADTITVTNLEGQHESAPLHRCDPQAFAKTLLRAIFYRTKELDL